MLKALIKKQTIKVTEIPPRIPFDCADADQLIVELDGSLVMTMQFQIVLDQIPLTEQIAWHLQTQTPKPIENYYYAYQIFTQNDKEVQGLACLIEKEKAEEILTAIKAVNPNCAELKTAEVTLWSNKISWWNQEGFLLRLNKKFQPLLAGAAGLILIVAVVFGWQNQRLFADQKLRQEELLVWENKEKQLLSEQARQQKIKEIKGQHQTIQILLVELTKQIPAAIWLTELDYETDKKLVLTGYSDQGAKPPVLLAKNLKKLEGVQSAAVTKTSGSEQAQFEIETFLGARLAKKNKTGGNS